MGYEQLSLNGFIQEMKAATNGAHPRRFCFILGAGASRSSGIKSGQELVKIWDKELQERNNEEYQRWRKELDITDKNMSNFYSYYYEKRFNRCPADGLSYIEGIMESAKPSAGYVMLAHMLAETPHNVVITTNFDHLTEDAVTYYAQKTPLVIGHESLSHYITGQPVRPTIIKIHRDLLFDPKSRSEDLEKLPDSWQSALERIFENYYPVFIGYAGNDKSLMDFLIKNGEKFASDQWKFPYWLLYKHDSLDGKVKEFLEKSEGIFVCHDGFDEVMIQLGAEFGYKIPTEEDFLKDAHNRYRTLKDAIDGFSDRSNPVNVADYKTATDDVSCEPAADSQSSNTDVDQAIEKITSDSELQNQFREAVRYTSAGKLVEALSILQSLVEKDPENARYHTKLAEVRYHLKEYENAMTVCQRAKELDPEADVPYIIAGMCYEKTGQKDLALTEYMSAKTLDPECELTRFRIASIMEEKGDKIEALFEYRMASEFDPDWERPHYAMGKILEELNRPEDALAEYQKAISISPNYGVAHYAIGCILKDSGKKDEALSAFQCAAAVDSDWGVAYYQVAELQAELGQFGQALESIEKAIEISPKTFYFYHSLSSILRKLNRDDEAKIAKATGDKLYNESKKEDIK